MTAESAQPPIRPRAFHPASEPPSLALDRARLAEVVAESERRLAALGEMQRALGSLRVETRSRDRAVSVTLGPGGVLTGLVFHSESYREMAPAELAGLVLDTAEKARREFAAKTEQIMAPLHADSLLPVAEIMAGTFDPAAFLAGPGERTGTTGRAATADRSGTADRNGAADRNGTAR